jgi:hypothetical protein
MLHLISAVLFTVAPSHARLLPATFAYAADSEAQPVSDEAPSAAAVGLAPKTTLLESEEPQRGGAGWTVMGTVGAIGIGGATFLGIGSAIDGALPPPRHISPSQRTAVLDIGGALVGIVGGALGGYFLGEKARDGSLLAKIGVIALNAVMGLAFVGFIGFVGLWAISGAFSGIGSCPGC